MVLVAFPESMRPAYAEQLARLTSHNTPSLLITLEYPQREMDGPPFSVPEREVRDLFGGLAEIELLETVPDAFDNFRRFREKGVSELSEKVYRLQCS